MEVKRQRRGVNFFLHLSMGPKDWCQVARCASKCLPSEPPHQSSSYLMSYHHLRDWIRDKVWKGYRHSDPLYTVRALLEGESSIRNFAKLGTKHLGHTQRRSLVGQSVGAFSRLAVDVGRASSLLALPGWQQKAGWTTHREEAPKQCSSMVSISVPASRSLLCLRSCLGFPQWWGVIKSYKIKLTFSSPKLLLVNVFHSHREP